MPVKANPISIPRDLLSDVESNGSILHIRRPSSNVDPDVSRAVRALVASDKWSKIEEPVVEQPAEVDEKDEGKRYDRHGKSKESSKTAVA